MDEKHYMKVSNTAKELLKACNLTEGEWELMVNTSQRIKAGVPLRDQTKQKEMIWNAFAKIIVDGKLMEILEIAETETTDDAKTRNEKFLEDAKEILKGNGDTTVVITKEKKVCPLFNRGPSFCKYGIVGQGCENEHPESCAKFDRKGERGCITPCSKEKYHRPICHKLARNQNCTGGKKCKAYHPPELVQLICQENENKTKEEEEKKKEEAERKVFLDQAPRLQEENEKLAKKIEELEEKLKDAKLTSPTQQMPMQQNQQLSDLQIQMNQIQRTLAGMQLQPVQMMPQQAQMQANQQRMPQLQWQSNQ